MDFWAEVQIWINVMFVALLFMVLIAPIAWFIDADRKR